MDNSNNIPGLLNKLCEELTQKQDAIKPAEAYELALSYMTSINEQNSMPDEKILCQKIHSRLSNVSGRDADKFNELFAKLKNTFVLKQPVSVLSLLLALSEAPQTTNSTQQLFPVPNLSVINSAVAFTGASSSKSTVGSASWGVNTPKQLNSNPSISTNNSNLVIATQSCNHANERACVRDAVLAATGVKARSSCNWSRPVQILYSRIAHLGFLHDKLKDFIDPASVFTPQGLMVEGLVAAIRDELTEYYRSVALLQSQVCESDGGGGTLRRVSVWAQDPLHRLNWLATIVHSVQHKRGGELATCVHRYVHNGDERVSALARRLLTSLTYPLLLMLTRWLLHGEIDDPYHEFFIESRNGVPIDRMWHDKYRVREWMVPSFMCREQAAQILATGKSVVFMREACADLPDQCDTSSDHAIHLQSLLAAHTRTGGTNTEAAWWEAEGLREGVETAHLMASQRLLAALTTHHHLLDHLAAHRRYLLLSQGDFVHHLMTLLQDNNGEFIIVPISDVIVVKSKQDGTRDDLNLTDNGRKQRHVVIETSRTLMFGNMADLNVMEHGVERFLKLPLKSGHCSQMDMEVKADENQLIIPGSSARLTSIVTDTRDVRSVVNLQVTNTGLAPAFFSVVPRECTPRILEGLEEATNTKKTLIPPMHTNIFIMELPLEISHDDYRCSIALLNGDGEAVATRDMSIKKNDRCFCVWHCECVCLGEDPKLICRDMSEVDVLAAGFSPHEGTRRVRSACYHDVVTINMFVIFFGVLLLLLILGLLKACIGLIIPCVGLMGMEYILKIPRKLDHYYESSLKCRPVVYDKEGWPVHPDTKKRTVHLVSKPMEFIINVMMFITLPCTILWDAVMQMINKCKKEENFRGTYQNTKKCFSSQDMKNVEPRWRRRKGDMRKWMTPQAEALSADIWHYGLSPTGEKKCDCRQPLLNENPRTKKKQQIFNDSEQDDTAYVLTQIQKSKESLKN